MDTKAKILIVDDQPEKLLALEAVLDDLHQILVLAHSGREALRHVLNHDFAVILLDVNMPGMDGFETASLIRQRSNSRHTPIIFITAYGDELHAARGYSLGAVDYILTPVVPDVLRTKVGVFVDLFTMTEQIKRQAESLQRRASQMQKLAAASLLINTALSIDRMLKTVTETARDIIGTHQAVTLFLAGDAAGAAGKSRAIGSFSEKYAAWNETELSIDALASVLAGRAQSATCMTQDELMDSPVWEVLCKTQIPPVSGGLLIAPLTGRNGANLGVIYLCDRYGGPFTRDDQALLVQLAQMGSIALENSVYAQEQHVNRVKDEFLATLSHELRTPLNAIMGWTQLLKMEKLDGQVAHGLDIIDRNARAQTKLIEDLLDVSRIASGKLRLNLSLTTLEPVIQAAVDAARPAAEAKKITLEVRLSAQSIPTMVDPDRIQQVAWNLLSNAIKFTGAGGRVFVELEHIVRSGAERLVLRVGDSGHGIDPRFLPYVFDRFRQADSTSTRPHGGLGIGLSIVRHIVEQHGGAVSAESAGVGRGATFSVELPVAARGAAPVRPLTSTDDREMHAPPAAQIPPAPGSLTGLRILVVDDESDACDIIAAALRHAGAFVVAANSAADAFHALDTVQPDLMVSDIAMPELDGYSLIRQIRRRPAGQRGDIPAIALTAYARKEDRTNALSAGYQAHLAKPIDQVELINCIAQLASGLKAAAPVMRLAR
jgi:signal transduction histidine kinase/DNA-binding response OmpR family regulator